eukprot:11225713-Lingulodinium_polyedra.AAC.1
MVPGHRAAGPGLGQPFSRLGACHQPSARVPASPESATTATQRPAGEGPSRLRGGPAPGTRALGLRDLWRGRGNSDTP